MTPELFESYTGINHDLLVNHLQALVILTLSCTIYYLQICDWLWENPTLMHKDKYLEIRSSVIQSVISLEGLKPHAYNLLQIYSHLIAKRLLTPHCRARCFPHHFRRFLSTPPALI